MAQDAVGYFCRFYSILIDAYTARRDVSLLRVTFFSNYFNSHQLPLALELCGIEGVEYTFVSLLKEGHAVGRASLDNEYPFVVKEYEGPEEALIAMRHALEDDIVVFGDMAGKERYVRARARTGLLFFRYAERLLKRGDWWRFVPPKRYRTWNMFCRYKKANMFVLCASAYTARDLSLFGFPSEKCLKWGYFPEVQLFPRKVPFDKRVLTMCSAQRLISWKRVNLQIELACKLKREGYAFKLYIAGDGAEREELEEMTRRLEVDTSVSFLGELSHKEVLSLMRSSNVFLATSDRNEGWGATINEAMASGCCVVASDEMGAVPYLIEDGVNGMAVKGASSESFYSAVEKLATTSEADYVSRAAVETIAGRWSAKNAVERLLRFACSKPMNLSPDDKQPITKCI